MKAAPNDGARAFGLSVFLHGALVAALAVSLWTWRKPVPPQAPSVIDATLVTLGATTTQPAPEPEPLPQQVPQPTPVEPPDAAQKQIEEQQAREQHEQEQKAAEAKVAADKAAEQKVADQKAELKAQQAKVDKARADKAKAEKDKAERDRAERDKAAKLEADKREQEKKKADDLAKQQAEAARAARQKELQASLAAEERMSAARSSGQMAEYQALIRARVEANWKRPPGAASGLNCQVKVTQVPGGTVTNVQVTSCNGDEAVRASIEAAVYRASPLPVPSNADLFDRNLIFNFTPRD